MGYIRTINNQLIDYAVHGFSQAHFQNRPSSLLPNPPSNDSSPPFIFSLTGAGKGWAISLFLNHPPTRPPAFACTLAGVVAVWITCSPGALRAVPVVLDRDDSGNVGPCCVSWWNGSTKPGCSVFQMQTLWSSEPQMIYLPSSLGARYKPI